MATIPSKTRLNAQLREMINFIIAWNGSQAEDDQVNISPLVERLQLIIETNNLEEARSIFGHFMRILVERRPPELQAEIREHMQAYSTCFKLWEKEVMADSNAGG